MTGNDLHHSFQSLCKMIGELNDGHVNLIQYGNDGAILRTKETK